MSPALALLAWYLALAAAGVAVWPLAARALGSLPGAGAALARPLGLLLGGLLLWLGNAVGAVGRGRSGAWALLGLVALAAWGSEALAAILRPGAAPARRRPPAWSPFLAGEALHAATFALWGLVRAWMPAARHTEQTTDLMFLHAVAGGAGFPPEDPWLAGAPLAYHDLGFWIAHWVARLAGVGPDVAFNLVQVGSLAILVHAAFGLGAALARLDGAAPRRALAAGGLAAAAVALAGHLAFWTVRGAGGNWWWAATRVVVDRDGAGGGVEMIHEFPFFSYLLGDPHAHVLAMPFALLLFGLLAAAAVESRERRPLRWALLALGGGAFLALDPWELPGIALIFILALLLRGLDRGHPPGAAALRALGGTAALLAAGLAVVAAWRSSAAGQVHGLLPNLDSPTGLLPGLLVAGQFLPGVVLLLALAAVRIGPSRRALALALLGPPLALVLALALAAALAGEPLAAVAASWTARVPVAPLLAAGAGAALLLLANGARGGAQEGGERLALLAAAAGLLLLLAPEIAFVHDAFGHRLNTVFKLSYQAWPLLALAAAHAAVWAWREGRRLRAWAAIAALLAGLPYAPLALAERLGERPPEWSLDALAHLAREAPAEAALLAWVRKHVPPGTRVLQAEGESYRPESVRLSTATARPALLGWIGHERQWRGREWEGLAAERSGAIRRIYEEAHGGELAALLARWRIGYVLVGPEERRRYRLSAQREAALAAVLPEVFAAADRRLFRVPSSEEAP